MNPISDARLRLCSLHLAESDIMQTTHDCETLKYDVPSPIYTIQPVVKPGCTSGLTTGCIV